MKKKYAIISVTDKTGIDVLAQALIKEHNYVIYSSGGTEAYLKQKGVDVTPVTQLTGNPEAFGGRMKTISFEMLSGILFRRQNPEDQKDALKLEIKPIDLVVCNLYPFDQVAQNPDSTQSELIENIDIGGPLMIRAAAKNYQDVTVLSSFDQYGAFLESLKTDSPEKQLQFRLQCALQAFNKIALYDTQITDVLHQKLRGVTQKTLLLKSPVELRYGENPHQSGFFYPLNNTVGGEFLNSNIGLGGFEFLNGKELSYNNYLDMDAAIKIVSDLKNQFSALNAVVVVKHGNPCGLSAHVSKVKALEAAWEGDPVSRFGGILAFTGEVDLELAKYLHPHFIEVICAPGFSAEALELLVTKKNLRLIRVNLKTKDQKEWSVKSLFGGVLLQTEDESNFNTCQVVAHENILTSKDQDLVKFGVIAIKYLKSNALAFVEAFDQPSSEGYHLVASGAGQPNRVDCLDKIMRPRLEQLSPERKSQGILVSDAFFPFSDIVEMAGQMGIKKIIQPGGSRSDDDVILKAKELGVGMGLTGVRHFRH